VKFVADKQFVFALSDRDRGLILLAGDVPDPIAVTSKNG